MAILGKLIKRGMLLRHKLKQSDMTLPEAQNMQLFHLLHQAQHTEFGRKWNFSTLIDHARASGLPHQELYRLFQENVPVYSYNSMYRDWWCKALDGGVDVCWPGQVKYFALSSGTSESASKRIPLTDDMIKALKKTSINQLTSMTNFPEIPEQAYTRDWLMLGGSTDLHDRGSYYEGDLSGIAASKLPFWFQKFYKPGRKISQIKVWDEKIEEIMAHAHLWDIGFLVGVPAWVQILLEKIRDHYKLTHIHELWPNLSVYTYSGVSIEPYRKNLESLMGKPVTFIETYLASEGFMAYHKNPGRDMELVADGGIFFEFVPFDEANFDSEGELRPGCQAVMIDQVQKDVDYAILISTCAGAWRYLIGDTVRFTNPHTGEIIITGRTKHFLSLCGEHLSVDNMNHAIEKLSTEFQIDIPEFTVAGLPHGSLFAHHWYLGTDEPAPDGETMAKSLDRFLCALNDDYAVERGSALREIRVTTLPVDRFYEWMKRRGKYGGQAKFPRVLKKNQHQEWLDFLNQNANILS